MRNIIITAITAGFLLAALLVPAMGQEDMTNIPTEAFTAPQRPAALFAHDAHNEKAGLEECGACHHLYEDGKLVPEESSEGTPCSECHQEKPQTGTSLRNAYHRQCVGCHEKEGKGPVACGQCHTTK